MSNTVKARRALTDAEKAERDADVRALLDAAVERVSTDGEALISFLVESNGWSYGWANRLMLWQQGARGPVMTYAQWRTAGRSVVRGSEGLWVYAGRFPRRSAFPVTATEGAPWALPARGDHPGVVAAMREVFDRGGLESATPRERRAILKAAVEAGRAVLADCAYCAEEGCESCMG